MAKIPKVGKTYEGISYGQGMGTVLEVEGRGEDWTRVFVEYCSGCCPVPPGGRPDAPEEEWELPRDRVWIERAEWERSLVTRCR